ncbi:tRNA-binding protein [Fulvivirga sp. M361]|uniref:tRNA-binding protein n=1 Tax=Fulvivirga sp. M361 TaxID=2594266 RepID=UPI001179F12E|nr:tRNA-binding protein [Fulvivirga sp. M361]TRX61402.1 tRNA-binding protein [Fulvivirga sp. M361]
MTVITWSDFDKVELRIGTIVNVEEFPEASRPAYKVSVDFGGDLGIKKSSAQITYHYAKEDLMNTQVICVVNFPKKQIGPFMSEVLITGFADADGHIVLARPDDKGDVPNGARLI